MPDLFPVPAGSDASSWVTGNGEMASLVRCLDWSRTPLGPMEDWSEELVRAVQICLESRHPIVLYWGPEFALIYNDAWRPIVGGKHPYALGRSAREIWREIWDVFGVLLEGVYTSGEPSWSEDQLLLLERHGFAEETYFSYSLSPVRNKQGEVAGIFTAVTETTQRFILARRLQMVRELADRLSASTTEAEVHANTVQVLAQNRGDIPLGVVYRLNQEGRQAERVAITDQTIGNGYPESIPLENTEPATSPVLDVLRTGRAMSIEFDATMSAAEGAELPRAPQSAMLLPILDTGRSATIGVLVVHLSRRLILDDEYRGFLELISQHITAGISRALALRDERRRAEALARIDHAKTAFFSNVSHEFRTPLTLILGTLEELDQSSSLIPADQEQITLAHRNSLRLLKLVNSLLDFTRIESGRATATFRPVDLSTLTIDIASNFRSATQKAGLEFNVNCPAMSEPVFVDRDMWEKIVSNLLSNAFKHTFEGTITIALAQTGGGAELRVADTGVGIAAEDAPHLFERFYRVEGSRARTHEGSGIGLALVQELVKLHGGRIEFNSKLDEGSCFTVTIPFGSSHLPSERVAPAQKAHEPSTAGETYLPEMLRWLPDEVPQSVVDETVEKMVQELDSATESSFNSSLEKPMILLAEDNADMRQYITRLLAPHMDVTAVTNGSEALEVAFRRTPDLVLSDVMMPLMGGFELLQKLRADPRTQTLPVILLSARAGEEARVEGIGAGADDYLTKPFTARELVARVISHLKMAKVRRESLDRLAQSEGRLRKANADLQQFTYSASHDLREPLRTILAFSQLIQRRLRNEDAEVLNLLEFVVNGATRMHNLLNDLLSYSKVDADWRSDEYTDTREELRAVLESLHVLINETKAQVTIGEELPPVPLAKVHVQQIFQNLVGNAIKYRSPNRTPEVHIGAKLLGENWLFCVKDNGIGIAPEHHASVFGIFSRLQRDEQDSGTGIGLAIVQRIVNRYGGKVWVESGLDKGATFFLTLPKEI